VIVMTDAALAGKIAEIARRADEAMANARADLVGAVRQASAQGMTQTEIARAIGRSQPEVSRLLHFHGTSPRAMALRKYRTDICHLISEAGGSNVRVFGSVATGQDTEESDIDLLFRMDETLGLFALAKLEREVSALVGYEVDLVPDANIIPMMRDRILVEAVAL
jgi:predicted nucleotidyltransferase/predicted XRE-type DNA-binding protein